jgi:FemAB family protein
MVQDALAAALAASQLDASLHSSDAADWCQVWQALPYQGVAADRAMLDYQHAYFRGAGWQLQDISLVLKTDGKPCGIWPLSLGGPLQDGQCQARLSTAGAAVQAPLFVDGLSPRTVKKICTRALQFLQLLGDALGLPPPVIEQDANPAAAHAGASEWHQQLMAQGALPHLHHDLYADLRPELADIRASFRKSFRPLINAGLRNWQVFLMDGANASAPVWAEFKQLHLSVAGRSTRSDESWALQWAMVASDCAFVVGLRDPADTRLVGAGLFQCTRDEGLYAVGAYDRALFDKPLGHVVQQRAIETMKARGLRWYRIGQCHYRQDRPTPSDKMTAISAFKQGFASHHFLRLQFLTPGSVEVSAAAELADTDQA